MFPGELIVSCPNEGGLVFVSRGRVAIIDLIDTTGLTFHGDSLVRCTIENEVSRLRVSTAAHHEIVLELPDLHDAHDVLVFESAYYVVSTGRNRVIKLGLTGALERVYEFPGMDDAWHLNCLAVLNQRVVVTAFGRFEAHRGYKNQSLNGGFLMDLESGAQLWSGLSQPHTPFADGDRLLICDSETKRLLAKTADGQVRATSFEGYPRGIAVSGGLIYVGLSCSRNLDTSAFSANAVIVALDRETLEPRHSIELPFREVYAVVPIPEAGYPAVLGIASRSLVGWHSCAVSFHKQLELLQRQLELQQSQLDSSAAQMNRLNVHPIVGPIIKALRRLKSDPSFGAFAGKAN